MIGTYQSKTKGTPFSGKFPKDIPSSQKKKTNLSENQQDYCTFAL